LIYPHTYQPRVDIVFQPAVEKYTYSNLSFIDYTVKTYYNYIVIKKGKYCLSERNGNDKF